MDTTQNTSGLDTLFRPFKLKSLNLKNRIVMAPMTRSFSPNGIPGENVVEYYKKRAEAEVGLILSEGTVIDRAASSNDPNIPHFYGDAALAGWQKVIENVHAVGGAMAPQIWHMGVMPNQGDWLPSSPFEGPSGYVAEGKKNGVAMTENDIADTIAAYASAAADAKRLGFDSVELHGAHGYLIDQFFWGAVNERTDGFGGKTLPERSRFAVEVIKAVRAAVGEDFAIIIRLSQWKQQNLSVKLAPTPDEMAAWLNPMADAGVDIFHCSQRRFWEPEFEGSDLNFAGWAKKLSGKTTISVGSVGLSGEFLAAFQGETSQPQSVDKLLNRMEKGEFDLIAVGRALLADPQWIEKLKAGTSDFKGFTKEALTTLV
jgi:2,4-dienoyl-CoA reductase-like NADH-dependent reductase (Old Yellow Enzyme family)